MPARSLPTKRGPFRKLQFDLLEDRLPLALLLDIGFDGDGTLATDYGFGDDSAQAVGFQSDDRIVVGGIVWNGLSEDFGLARYFSDGTLDRTFGVNGGIRTDFVGDHDRLLGLTVQPDDKIIAVGSSFFTDGFGNRRTNFAITRYLPNGELDSTFGNVSPGQSLIDFFGGTDDIARDVVVLNNGQILVSGDAFNPFTGNTDFTMARLNGNGTLDASFGNLGLVAVDGFGGFDQAEAIAVQPDGRIILAGLGQNGASGEDMLFMRFNANGTLDTSFFGSGKTTINFGSGADRAFAIDLQADGKIVAAGSTFVSGNGFDFALLRLNTDGTLDTSFGNGGGVLTDFGKGDDAAFSVDVLPDGRILATGEAFIIANLDVALATYNSDGSPDTSRLPGDSFSPPGTVTTDFGFGHDSGVSTFVENDGSILVVGRAFILNDTDFAVARYSEPRSGPTGNIDTDGDGLLDDWEVNGLDINGDGLVDLDLPGLGANPMRKDLFVEVDSMVGRAPFPGVIDSVIQSFADAPVVNVDGSSGIRLHVVMDEFDLPVVNWPEMDPFQGFPIGASQTYETNFGTDAERASGNFANIRAAKEQTFRYGIFGNTYNDPPGSSGIARGIPGDMFVVTLATFGPAEDFAAQAGTFLHEFGHTLGLRHGGSDHVNNKPDYFSVMNYLYQMRSPQNQDIWRLDYDREATVYDDWGNIVYNFRQTNSGLAGVSSRTESFKQFEEPPNPNVPLALLVGDIDGDGTVAFPDFLLLASSFGNEVPVGSRADLNSDGTVAFPDFLLLAQNFGRKSMPAAPNAVTSVVPDSVRGSLIEGLFAQGQIELISDAWSPLSTNTTLHDSWGEP